jgi:hypothetical protein
MNQAGEAVMGAAKEFLGNAIQEMFVKKQSDVKRILPSIKNMKVVSVRFDPPTMSKCVCGVAFGFTIFTRPRMKRRR